MKTKAKKDTKKAANIIDTAEVLGLSQSTVQKVLRGDRENPNVINVFMILDEGKNKLLKAVKELVPFN